MNTEMDKFVSATQFTSEFIEIIHHAYRLLLEDSQFRIVLHENGFNSTGISGWYSVESDGRNDVPLHSETGDSCVMFVHQSAVVSEKKCIESSHLVFQLREPSKPGLFYLQMDKNMHQLGKADSDFPTSEVMVLLEIADGNQPVLSSQLFYEKWKSRAGRNFVLMFRLASMNESELEPFSVKSMPAIVLETWPSMAVPWKSRPRQWPSQETIEEARKQHIYSVPLVSLLPGSLMHTDCKDACSWLFDFREVEAVLINSMSDFQKQLFHLFIKLYWEKNSCRSCASVRNIQLRHVFFWSLEKAWGMPWNEENKVNCFNEVCKTALSFLEANHFPHYFMPEFDLVSLVQHCTFSCHASCTDQCLVFCDMMENDKGSLVPAANINLDNEGDEKMRQMKLANLFDQSINLLFMQLYQRLHSTHSLDDSIKYHVDMLQYLNQSSDNGNTHAELRITFQAWVNASLGVKYMIKWKDSICAVSKSELLRMAEEHLNKSIELTPQSEMSLLCLALFLFTTQCTTSLLLRLKNRFKRNEMSNRYSVDADLRMSADGTPLSSRELVQNWVCSYDKLDFIFSQFEEPLLSILPGVWRTVAFARCHLLGCPSFSVFALSSGFLNNILFLLSLANNGETDKAFQILNNLEKELTEELQAPFTHEKTMIARYFILASVHLKFNCKKDAVRLLKLSQSLFLTPRNPATMKLYQMHINKIKNYMCWGANLLLVGGILVAVAALIHWYCSGNLTM